MKVALTHIALHVRDIAASVDFYTKFCGFTVSHDRIDEDSRVTWLADERGEADVILVLISGGKRPAQDAHDVSHLGFDVGSRDAVDEIARIGADRLVWPPQDHPPPVGYFCALKDPDGFYVEFSHGQPIGPGAGRGPAR